RQWRRAQRVQPEHRHPLNGRSIKRSAPRLSPWCGLFFIERPGCKRMKTSSALSLAALLAAAVCVHGSCLAGEINFNNGTGNFLGALAGSAVSTAELNQQH